MAKKSLPNESALFNNPFAKLGATVSGLPPGPVPSAISTSEKKTLASSSGAPSRAVVRYERKGHGGKEMTRVEQLGLSSAELARWLKEAKQSLGCGGVVAGETLLLQGDQRDRLRLWLESRGVGTVMMS